MNHTKTFEAINKLKDIELELHRLKNALEMANKALDSLCAPQPKQDTNQPVAWMDIDEKGAASGLRYWSEPDNRHEVALYTTPPQRKPLTDEEIEQMWERTGDYESFSRAIEHAHGIKE